MPEALVINSRLTIPEHELSVSAVRGGGPGGQNVNKVASKVELRFQLDASSVLSPAVKARLRDLAGSRVTTSGELLIVAGSQRDQARNLADARERLRIFVLQALIPPKPRRKTKPSRGSIERRLKDKRQSSERKADRRSKD